MTLGIADIDRWDPQTVRDAAAAADGRADAAAETALVLQMLPAFAEWDGLAAAAARLSLAVTGAGLEANAEAARAVARAAADAAEEIAAIKTDLRDLEDTAGTAFLDIDRESGAVRRAPGFRGSTEDFSNAATGISDRLAQLLARADAVDTRLAEAITRASRLEIPAHPPAAGDLPPAEVNRWWGSLTERTRTALAAEDPQRYGNCDGIPAADRDRANRAAMEADLRRVSDAADRAGVGVEQVIADPRRFGLSAAELTRYTNAEQIRSGLDDAVLRTGATVLLWSYAPEAFGGQGRAAIAIGDPDRARNTTVVVPGTANSVAGGWLREDDAANVFNELSLAQPGGTHAVVAWMGYDAPDSLADPRVCQPALAREGGALLASDVIALAATHLGASGHLTVVGHSYGSTTVADAAAGSGMRVDDVVLVGSPGTDLARTAADFHLPDDGHVYVGAASTDPVRLVAGLRGEVGLGADPAVDGFGSTRFKAEVPGWTLNPVAEHSGYFDDGSESLYSIADVAAGDGERLQEHGMTAPHRDAALGALATRLGLPSWSTPFTDPELGRAGTSDNRHQPDG